MYCRAHTFMLKVWAPFILVQEYRSELAALSA